MKNVLITGGSRGIGRACSIKFAKEGYNLIINYISDDINAIDLKKYLEEKYKISVFLYKGDISKEDIVIDMVNNAILKYSHIDVLINNAAIAIDNDIELKCANEFKRVIDVNLIGTFLVSKYVSKYMLKEKKGRIINVSSTNGIDTYYPASIDYDASKAGVISLTHNFARYLSPYINVNCVAPGWVNTDMNKEIEENFRKKEEDKILLKRFGESEEIANVIYFLSTDNASYINNSIIRVDGGKRE